MYGLTTEGYGLAAKLVDRAEVTIIDENLQMAMQLDDSFLRSKFGLGEVMSSEPIMSFKPLESVLSDANVIFFTPKLRRPFEESLTEANSKLRDLAKYIPKRAIVVNTLPTGFKGNLENIALIEKQTGYKVGEDLCYVYMPLRARSTEPSVIAFEGEKYKTLMELLGIKPNSKSIVSAELEYIGRILIEAITTVSEIELMRSAREAKVEMMWDYKESYIDDFASSLYELKAILSGEESGDLIPYLAGAFIKSLENYVRYIIDETRELLKEKGSKASKTKIVLLWTIDKYEMRADRLFLAQSIQQRLRDYVTDVEIADGFSLLSGMGVLDPLKNNLVIVCSRDDMESLKKVRKGGRGVDMFVLSATPRLMKE